MLTERTRENVPRKDTVQHVHVHFLKSLVVFGRQGS